MSRFFSKKFSSLIPYTPGEQPTDTKYIKLNTNESPYPLGGDVQKRVADETAKLNLYPDPECRKLRSSLAALYGNRPGQFIITNGSDEILNFAFAAFSDAEHPIVFPDITYGFYTVFAELNGIPYEEIPLTDDLRIDIDDYININKNIVIANPNAPTGIALTLDEIEKIVQSNPDNVVTVDEAYVDFGAESAINLIDKYDNLLVTRTFSKSRSLAGARLGFGIGNEKLIADLETIRYSTNPYNINRMTEAAGLAAISSNDYFTEMCRVIAETRDYTADKLRELGFFVTDSKTNFIFASSEKINGRELYLKLKEKGVLIRHFDKERIKDFNRISIGTKEQMDIFIEKVKHITEGVV